MMNTLVHLFLKFNHTFYDIIKFSVYGIDLNISDEDEKYQSDWKDTFNIYIFLNSCDNDK